jgi:hypothetical protein
MSLRSGKEETQMTESQTLTSLVIASTVNLVANTLGTILALQHNLPADFGGFLNGQNVLRDFLGFNGTALSAPFPFMLIQLALTFLTLRPGQLKAIGVKGLTFVGALYTVAQLGEPIVLRLLQPRGFDLAQALVLLLALISSTAMFLFGVREWRELRTTQPVSSRS